MLNNPIERPESKFAVETEDICMSLIAAETRSTTSSALRGRIWLDQVMDEPVTPATRSSDHPQT